MDEEFTNYSEDDAADAFLRAQPDYVDPDEEERKKKPPVEDTDGDEDEAEVEETEADEGSDEEAEGDEEEVASVDADDEANVKVLVDGKELAVKVKDLKRLYGQEASLTQRSQSLAQAAKTVENSSMFIAKILDQRLQVSRAKVAKYADVDLFKANRELSPEDFDAIREAKKDADAELLALESDAATFVQNAHTHRRELLRDRAKTALVEISKSIPDWNDELYGKIRTYAISQGFDRDAVNDIVDPGAIIMMHKAMRFDAAKAKTSENVTKKVIKTSKTIAKKSESGGDYNASKLKSVNRTARVSGDIDDIVDAYLANSKSK